MITGVSPEIQAQVERMMLDKLREFWERSPDELRVPLELPDGIVSLVEQACDWIAGECETLGTKLAGDDAPIAIETRIYVRRVMSNMIEYEICVGSEGGEHRTFHANRTATFTGPHTGRDEPQVHGPASTLWRESNTDMLAAFRSAFPGAHVEIVG